MVAHQLSSTIGFQLDTIAVPRKGKKVRVWLSTYRSLLLQTIALYRVDIISQVATGNRKPLALWQLVFLHSLLCPHHFFNI